jgi:hypothetical protein
VQCRAAGRITIAVVACLAGAARAEAAEPEGRVPGGTFYVGLGANLVVAESPGAGGSVGIALELRRALVQAEFLAAGGAHDYGTLLGSASAGAVLSAANDAPYLLGGVGYLARGSFSGDPSIGPKREHVVLTGEVGYMFGRDRRWGQIWAGLRVLVPVVTTATSGTPLPDLPWGLLTVRFLL